MLTTVFILLCAFAVLSGNIVLGFIKGYFPLFPMMSDARLERSRHPYLFWGLWGTFVAVAALWLCIGVRVVAFAP